MSAGLVLALPAGDDGACAPDPHPELVLAQKPTVPDLMEAIAVLGGFADGSYLSGQIRISGML